MRKDTCSQTFVCSVNIRRFLRIFLWINLKKRGRHGGCFLCSPREGMQRRGALPTGGGSRSRLTVVLLFSHYSIIEGHSFTITVGLWVSADLILTVALWKVSGSSGQERLAFSSFVLWCDDLFLLMMSWQIDASSLWWMMNLIEHIPKQLSSTWTTWWIFRIMLQYLLDTSWLKVNK